MPQLTKEEFMALIKEIDSNTIPLTMNLSADKEEKALKECEDYLNSIYSSIVEISKIKKWKKSIVKYGNKLYELNN